MEKAKCGPSSQTTWQANIKKLPSNIVISFVAGKIFERLLYGRMFEVFIENNLISKNQSSFIPGDSCINQLPSIIRKIYQSFDDNLEVRLVFLNISKAFDKIWHKGLIFKLKQNGISDKILNIISENKGSF